MTRDLRHTLTGLAFLLLIATAVWFAFGPAVDAPLVFDDHFSVIHNDSLRSLWPLSGPLQPPRDTPFAGRPLVNLSAAVNYHFSQLDPTGYRLFNLAIHFASAGLLFGIVRRTLQLDFFSWLAPLGDRERNATWLAFAVALWWAVHPLQVDAVSYLTQRTELLMGLCYLATLYFSLRFWQAAAAKWRVVWLVLAVAACAAGMASKEVMVSAPVIVLLYQRTFLSGSFRQAVRNSWPLYVGLFSTWLLLAYLNIGAPRAQSAGFHLSVSPMSWWLTQAEVVVMYLRLAFWPWPLSIHYEIPYLQTPAEAWPYLLIVALLGGGTLWALWRGWAIGFLGAWFFIILSPTSLVPITTEVAAERRMYLPLAAIVALVVVGGIWLIQILFARGGAGTPDRARRLWPTLAAILAIAIPAVILAKTSARYAAILSDPVALWTHTLERYPRSDLAHVNLGCALLNADKNQEAIDYFSKAVAINSNSADAHYNWAVALRKLDRRQEALAHLALAVELNPDSYLYRKDLGDLLVLLEEHEAAAEQFAAAAQLDPKAASVRNDLGMALKQSNQLAKAAEALAEAVGLRPELPEFRNNYGNVLRLMGQHVAAIVQFQEALKLEPGMREAQFNLALATSALGRRDDAIATLKILLADHPDDAAAHAALGSELIALGRLDEAKTHFVRTVELEPAQLDARNNLGAVLIELGQVDEAEKQLREAIRLGPDSPVAHFNLAEALAAAGKRGEAIAQARQALELAKKSGATGLVGQIDAWLKALESGNNPNPPATP